MSGRKATEVNSLLARGKTAREAGEANYLSNIEKNINSMRDCENKSKHISEEISEINLSKDSAREFPNEYNILKKQFQDCKNEITVISQENYIKKVNEKKRNIQNRLCDADIKSEDISKRIRNKSHYCDNEYAEASMLVEEYKKIAAEKNQLVNSVNSEAAKCKKIYANNTNVDCRIKKLLDNAKKLNDRAKQVVELREEATAAKQSISDQFLSIDKNKGEKFRNEEYKQLYKQVGEFQNYTDKEVVQSFAKFSEKINILSCDIEKCYAEYQQKKRNAELALESNQQLLTIGSNFFFDPADYHKNGDKGKKIDLLHYINEYSDKQNMVQEIKNCIDKIQELIEHEEFEVAEIKSESLKSDIEKAVAYAVLLQEHLIENYEIARDMKAVMNNMGYKTGAYKIDGHVKNGWRIVAESNSGEVIDFSKVFVSEDGAVDISIDHKIAGECGARWKDICKAFDEKGLYLENVTMENGGIVTSNREIEQQHLGMGNGNNIQVRQR